MVNQIYYANIGGMTSSRPAKAYDFTNGRRKVYSAGAWHDMDDSSTNTVAAVFTNKGRVAQLERLVANRTKSFLREHYQHELTRGGYGVLVAILIEALTDRELRESILCEAERRAEAKRLGWGHVYE